MKQIKLLLMGAGTVYPLHVGAILRLAEAGYEFSEVAGSSWGSIVVAALGSGYAPNTELTKLIKQALPIKQNVIEQSYWSLYRKWGTVRTKKLNASLDKFFVNRIDDMKIPVKFIATDVEQDFPTIFDLTNTPGMRTSAAVAASMAVPMFMEPVKIDGKYYVDGATCSKFPIDLFGEEETIVLRAESIAETSKPVKSMKNYIEASINSWAKSHSSEHIPSKMMPHTIRLKTSKLPFDLTLTDSDIDQMVAEGYNAAGEWLNNN